MIRCAAGFAAVDQQPHLETHPPERTDDLEDDGGGFAHRGFAHRSFADQQRQSTSSGAQVPTEGLRQRVGLQSAIAIYRWMVKLQHYLYD